MVLNATLLPPGSSLTLKAAAVPVSTTAAVVATATILPPSRIVRQSVSTQEGKTYLHPFTSLPITNMLLLGQEGNMTLTHALSLWTAGLAGP